MVSLLFSSTCKSLRKKGMSLGRIAELTGRPKTSVYFHIRNLPVSSAVRAHWQKSATERIVQFNRQRLGRSALGRYPNAFSTWTPPLVFVIAHLLFDGEIKRYGCSYNNRNLALIRQVRTAMRELYDFKPKYYLNSHTEVRRIAYYNVSLGVYAKQKAEELLQYIPNQPREHQRIFLKAFFDDEGCMDFRPKERRRSVRGYQKNISLLRLIQQLLITFSIESRLQKPNEVIVTGRENLQRFQKEINFSPGVKINGERTNSSWKKHLEKRVLLQKALSSFIAKG